MENKNMNFELFATQMQSDISAEFEVGTKMEPVTKPTGSYSGMIIMISDTLGMSVNMDEAYEVYQNKGYKASFRHVAEMVNNGFRMSNPVMSVATSQVMDYSWVKSHLRLQLVSFNGDMTDIPHKVIAEDMALIYRIELNAGTENGCSTVITNQLMAAYGITHEQLHKDALIAVQLHHPAVFEPLETRISALAAETNGNTIFPMPSSPLRIATSNDGCWGASVIVYPGFLERVRESLGGDFYILPSSIHEVLIIPMSDPMGNLSPAELDTLVREVNENELAPSDILSNHAYAYYKGQIIAASDYPVADVHAGRAM